MMVPFLASKRLYLRPLESADAEGPYVSWFNDADVCRSNSHHLLPYTREAALAYIEYARQTKDSLILAVTLLEDNRHIGNVALQQIHPVYRSAEFSIILGD